MTRHETNIRTGDPRATQAFTACRPGWATALAVSGLFGMALHSATAEAGIRWASSSNRIYIEDGTIATLSDIKAAQDHAPLDLVDAAGKIWLLRANLQIEDGSTLVLHGSAAGGDVDELRLQSNNSISVGSYVAITADNGTIDIASTRIKSWDTVTGAPDEEFATYGRAFIRVRSKLGLDGVTAQESRMDILDSDIGYLGFDASESYGLSWKVNGDTPGLYDLVQVRGNITNSHIHHNYFGVYTYGHQDGEWRNNEVDNNVVYGFDPHDDSDNIIIANNNVHHNGSHGIIASQRCDHIQILDNESWENAGNGIMLHRTSDDGLVEGNQSYNNGDSGIAIFASSRTQVLNNSFTSNANAGIRLSNDATDNHVENNEIGASGRYGIYLYQGSDEPNPGGDGRPKRNWFVLNQIHHSVEDGARLSDADASEFVGNVFENNGLGLRLTNSIATHFDSNMLPNDVTVVLAGSALVPTTATFSRQPLVNLGLDSFSSTRFEDSDKAIFDPEEPAFTTATSAGSFLNLDYALTGLSTVVHTRALFANPLTGGSVQVDPTAWTMTDRRWVAKTSAKGAMIAYTVGDLEPGTRYTVRAKNKILARLVADPAGRITFTARSKNTGAVNYRVSL